MNRIIKFRAWDKVTKKMVDIDLLDFATTETHRAWRASVGEVWLVQFGKEHRTKDEIELMQFTGLYDKNGKEVYEGDIVKCSKGCPHKIVWGGGNEMPGWWLDGTIVGPMGDYAWLKTEEIIGNVWEHPELLEVTDTNGNP